PDPLSRSLRTLPYGRVSAVSSLAVGLLPRSRHCWRNDLSSIGRRSRVAVQAASGGAIHETKRPTEPMRFLRTTNLCSRCANFPLNSYQRGLIMIAAHSLKESLSAVLCLLRS